MYYEGFDTRGFIEYVEDIYELNVDAIQIVFNIIDYAYKHHNVSKDMFAEFLWEMFKGLRDIDFYEIAKYCSDEMLARDTLKALGRI